MRYLYRSRSGQGAAVLLLSSALMFMFLVLLLAIAPELTSMQGWVLIFILVLLAVFVAYSKMTEPYYVIEINAQGVCWCGQVWDGEKMCRPSASTNEALEEASNTIATNETAHRL